MTQVNQLVPHARYRRIAKGGGLPIDAINATMREAILDINNIQAFINESVWPIMQGLFLGQGRDIGLDAIDAIGASGRTIPTDHLATSADTDLLWTVSNSRRMSVKESILLLSDKIDDSVADLQALINGITGATAYDDTSVRSLISANTFGIERLARDMMGANYWSSFTFANGSQTLTNSLGKLVKALLDEHNGTTLLNDYSFAASPAITLSHTYAISQLVADVCLNPAYVCTSAFAVKGRGATVATLQDDINRLRWEIGHTRNGGDWETSAIPGYGGGPTNLEGHIQDVGTGTPNANNPHGLRMANLTDWATFLAAYMGFTGSSGFADAAPTYSSTSYVTTGNSLETAIGDLDAALTAVDVLTTKGDILSIAAGVYARLPIGGNGTFLEADSGEATGLKWGLAPIEYLISSETLHPNSVGTTLAGTSGHAQLDNFESSASAWIQTSRLFVEPTGDDVPLNCWVTVPTVDKGALGEFYPSKVRIYINLVQAVTDAGLSTFRLSILNYGVGTAGAPCLDGVDLDPTGVLYTQDIIIGDAGVGWTGDILEVADYDAMDIDTPGMGQLNFIITRLNAGDTNTQDIHLLSVGVNWYGPLVS
jgi:hypothetical protein